jgi:hypothetical protein
VPRVTREITRRISFGVGVPARERVILEGVESGEAEESLYSTVHGAGRVMSRTEAAGRFRKGRQIKRGKVDWPAVRTRLKEHGIVLVGGGADEAPEVYKRLPRRPRGARRLDPGQAHPETAGGGDGRAGRPGSIQGLRITPRLPMLEFDYAAGAKNALKVARELGWTVVSVKDDWATVFADPAA